MKFINWYIIFSLKIHMHRLFLQVAELNEWVSVSADIKAFIMPNAEDIALSGSALEMKTKWMAAWRAAKPKGLNARCTHKGGWLPPHCENNSFIISGLQWVASGRGRVLGLTTKVTDNCRWNVESANWTHSATINCLRIRYPIACFYQDARCFQGVKDEVRMWSLLGKGFRSWVRQVAHPARNNRPAFVLN